MLGISQLKALNYDVYELNLMALEVPLSHKIVNFLIMCAKINRHLLVGATLQSV